MTYSSHSTFELLSKAEAGDADAQYRLGLLYRDGGIATEALKWFRAAADSGHAEAWLSLGYIHSKGLVVPQNREEARKCFLAGAERGNAQAQVLIGLSYANGPNANYAEAVTWYRLAAEQGEPLAQSYLSMMYEEGRGIEQDLVQAYKWYSLSRGHQRLEDIAAKMTSAQIAEAKRLASDWKPAAPSPDKPQE